MNLRELLKKLCEIQSENERNNIHNETAINLGMIVFELRREINANPYMLDNDLISKILDLDDAEKYFKRYKELEDSKEREMILRRILGISHNAFTLAGFKLPKGY